jgi:hypothetical protein
VVISYYPHDFPSEAQAKVEAEKIRAGQAFDKAKEQLPANKWGSIPDVEKLLKQLILSVFAVFAHEACKLGRRGVWPVVQLHSECLEFLRRFTLEAYSNKGYDTNANRIALRMPDKELKESPEWKKYDDERFEVTQLQSVPLKPAKQAQSDDAKSAKEARAKTVAKLIKELDILKPQMLEEESEYNSLRARYSDFLTFKIAERRPDLKTKILAIQSSTRHLRLAQQLAAAHHGRELSTIKDDWKRQKPTEFKRRG